MNWLKKRCKMLIEKPKTREEIDEMIKKVVSDAWRKCIMDGPMKVIGVDCPGGLLDSLAELRDFITGTGRFRLLGNGMHTYPGRDKNNQKIHDACLQLEAMGLIKRTIDESGHVVWIAKKGE